MIVIQPNIGTLDKSIRITLSLTALAIYFIEIVDYKTNRLFLITACVLMLTAVIGHCPLYRYWHYTTREKERLD